MSLNILKVKELKDKINNGAIELIPEYIELLESFVPKEDENVKLNTWLKKKYGNTDMNNLLKYLKSTPFPMPWENENTFGSTDQPMSKVYSMFPLKNNEHIDYEFFCKQESQLWSAKELDFAEDRKEYPSLKPRYQQLYKELLGFFSPSDGIITRQLMRYLSESLTYSEMVFKICQIFNEASHSESYGMSITSIIPKLSDQEEVFGMIDNLDCVKAKANFILKYENSDLPAGLRYIAGAASEGVFFMSLFALIFYFRSKNIMKTFIFLNKQVMKDELLHRDYNAIKASILKGFTYEEAVAILIEAKNIEMNHLKFLLRTPIDSIEADTAAGLTIEKIELFVESLCDKILILAGFYPYFNAIADLSWTKDMDFLNKGNFYECLIQDYKRKDLATMLDWNGRLGNNIEIEINATENPNDVDF